MRTLGCAVVLVSEVLVAVVVGSLIAVWTILSGTPSADWGNWEGHRAYTSADVLEANRLKLHAKARGIGFGYFLGTRTLEGGVTLVDVAWARERNKNAR